MFITSGECWKILVAWSSGMSDEQNIRKSLSISLQYRMLGAGLSLQFTTLHCSVVYSGSDKQCTVQWKGLDARHCSTAQYSALKHSNVHCIAMKCNALKSSANQCTVVHCITLQCREMKLTWCSVSCIQTSYFFMKWKYVLHLFNNHISLSFNIL